MEQRRNSSVNRNYKDTLFRMIFREKDKLLSLYNAVNGTEYTNPDELEIVTLENAIYMNMKNDLAFVVGCSLNLYEHQSTYSPNMPLRNLFYIARELEMLVNRRSLYSRKLVTIPKPRFIVFYNGVDEPWERKVLKLSDAYQQKDDEPELELKVTVLNINLGNNNDILEKCSILLEYMQYVEKVRTYALLMGISEAVERAVDECIQEGILSEFLLRYRSEAIQMSIFEYDEEKELKIIRQDERDMGREEGRQEGIQQGIEAFIQDNLEEHILEERIIEKLEKRFGFEREKAVKLLEQYKGGR